MKKMKKGTKPTMELTSSPYKHELQVKENINKRKKPILDLNKVKTEMGQTSVKRRNTEESSNKKKKEKAKESWLCKICEEDHVENMIQCIKCKDWIHDLCAGVERKIKPNYVCDICV